MRMMNVLVSNMETVIIKRDWSIAIRKRYTCRHEPMLKGRVIRKETISTLLTMIAGPFKH